MADSFVYQPHVHMPNGVLTPDLVVDRLLLISGSGGRWVPLGLNLLTTTRALQDPSPGGCASAALVLISGGRGTVVTVGSAHWAPQVGQSGGFVSEQLTPKPIAREAVRIKSFEEGRSAGVLSTYRRSGDSEVLIGKTAVAELPDISRQLSTWSGSDAPRRTALLISAGHADSEPGRATGYRVALSGLAGAPDLEVGYSVQRLVEQVPLTSSGISTRRTE
jgi:hypothetical protein